MKDMRNCKIVQDLLPNYIEKLTNDETNKFVELHLNECEECKKVYNNMKKELEPKAEHRDKREVKYIKKFNKKLKVLKILLAVILIVYLVVIVSKFIIIKSMQGKIKDYKGVTNYKTTMTTYRGDTLEKANIYHKDGKYLISVEFINGKDVRKIISTKEGNNYITSNDEKIAILGGMPLGTADKVYNYLETENIGEFIANLFTLNISSVKCNNKDCYKIDNFKSPDILYPEQGLCVYIDKETGLLVRVERGDQFGSEIFTTVIDYSYEFNKVTDTDLKEPDINEYKVQQ